MTITELANILSAMYNDAPDKEKATMIHLFGIKYSEEIRCNKYIPKEILKIAGMREAYQAEINKGIKLAKYVKVK
jgi:hypothetical protein